MAAWLSRAAALLRRHPWSLTLSVLSALCFVRLASEIREGELTQFDALVADALTRWRGILDPLMLGLTRLGDWRSLTLLSVVVVAWLLVKRCLKGAAFVALAAGGTVLLHWGLKLLFHRARPDLTAIYLVATPSSFSFPSGHAMCTAGLLAGLAVVVRTLGWRPVWPRLIAGGCLLLALGVGASRVYLGVHFASDVVGGQLAAAAWVSALTGWFYPRVLRGEG